MVVAIVTSVVCMGLHQVIDETLFNVETTQKKLFHHKMNMNI